MGFIVVLCIVAACVMRSEANSIAAADVVPSVGVAAPVPVVAVAPAAAVVPLVPPETSEAVPVSAVAATVPVAVAAVPESVAVSAVPVQGVVPAQEASISGFHKVTYETWLNNAVVTSFDVEYNCGGVPLCQATKGTTTIMAPSKQGVNLRVVNATPSEIYGTFDAEAKRFPITFAYLKQ